MLYIRQKNGLIEEITKKEFDEININFFRTLNPEKTIFFVNEDSKNIIPYIKDILNRKHKFIEILYLKIILIITISSLFLGIFTLLLSYKAYKGIKTMPTIQQNIQNEKPQEKNIINTKKPL